MQLLLFDDASMYLNPDPVIAKSPGPPRVVLEEPGARSRTSDFTFNQGFTMPTYESRESL
jgi:hypothetical protein